MTVNSISEDRENRPCPCGSGKRYRECCGKYHQGLAYPEDALTLMKSRYSAYALGIPDYILATTHPQNPRYENDKVAWSLGILEFSRNTQFLGLEILEVIPQRKDGIATVTFKVTLRQGDRDASFKEKSYFAKLNGKWLYFNGDMLEIE